MKGFEWDENKRELNLEKHGLDFIDAVQVFIDPNRIEAETKHSEKRYQTIGIVNGVVIFLVYTHRGTNRRIISARRASQNERKFYYQAE